MSAKAMRVRHVVPEIPVRAQLMIDEWCRQLPNIPIPWTKPQIMAHIHAEESIVLTHEAPARIDPQAVQAIVGKNLFDLNLYYYYESPWRWTVLVIEPQ